MPSTIKPLSGVPSAVPPPGESYLPDLPEDAPLSASSALPSLTELTMGDLTSMLVKTGQVQPAENELERLNITEGLEVRKPPGHP